MVINQNPYCPSYAGFPVAFARGVNVLALRPGLEPGTFRLTGGRLLPSELPEKDEKTRGGTSEKAAGVCRVFPVEPTGFEPAPSALKERGPCLLVYGSRVAPRGRFDSSLTARSYSTAPASKPMILSWTIPQGSALETGACRPARAPALIAYSVQGTILPPLPCRDSALPLSYRSRAE